MCQMQCVRYNVKDAMREMESVTCNVDCLSPYVQSWKKIICHNIRHKSKHRLVFCSFIVIWN